jgi:hypothetical protein
MRNKDGLQLGNEGGMNMWIGIRKAPEDEGKKDLRSRLEAAFGGTAGKQIKDEVKQRTEKPEGEKRTAEELRDVPVEAPTTGRTGAKLRGVEEEDLAGKTVVGTEESEAMKQKRQEIYDQAIAQGNTPARAQALAEGYRVFEPKGKAPPPPRESKRVSEDKERGPSLGRGIGAKRATFDIDDTRSQKFRSRTGRREKDIATEAGEGGIVGFGGETRVIDDTGQNPYMGSKKKGPKEAKTLESYLNSLMSRAPDKFMTEILGREYPDIVSRRGSGGQEAVRNELIRQFGQMNELNKDALVDNIIAHMNRMGLQLGGAGYETSEGKAGGSASMTGIEGDTVSREEFMQRVFGEGRDVTQDPGFKQRVDPSAMEVTGISDEEKLSNLIDMAAKRNEMSPDDEQRLRDTVARLQQQQGTGLFELRPNELVGRAVLEVEAGTDQALHQRNMANLRANFTKLIAQENALADMAETNPSLRRRLSEIRDQRRMIESQIKGGAPPERAPQRSDKKLNRKQGEYVEVETPEGPRMKFIESKETIDPTLLTESGMTENLGLDPTAVGEGLTPQQKANLAMSGMSEEEREQMMRDMEAALTSRDDDDEPPAPVATGFPMYIGDVLMKSVQNRLWWQGL